MEEIIRKEEDNTLTLSVCLFVCNVLFVAAAPLGAHAYLVQDAPLVV